MTTETWREGRHLSEGVAVATDAVAEAKAAEAAAFDRVDVLRGEFALGRVARGEVQKAQRKLALAQEATGVAEAKIRAVARDEARAAAAEIERREEERRALVAELLPEREAIEGDVAAILAIFLEEIDELAPRFADWRSRADRAAPTRGRPTGVLAGSLAHLTSEDAALMQAYAAARRAFKQLTTRGGHR